MRVFYARLTCVARTGGSPDSSAIGAAEPQEVFHDPRNPSCACGTPIAELSRPPAVPFSGRSIPVAEELQAVLHFFGRLGGDKPQQATHLFADGVVLLPGHDYACVGSLFREPAGM